MAKRQISSRSCSCRESSPLLFTSTRWLQVMHMSAICPSKTPPSEPRERRPSESNTSMGGPPAAGRK